MRKLFEQAKRAITGNLNSIKFVTPADSVLLAAATITGWNAERVEFAPDARRYVENNGLMSVFDGTYSPPDRSGQQGETYTKLTRLANHSEVHGCNEIINDLFRQQLGSYSQKGVNMLCKVVGELHDNVASHADGMGYSAAQVYRSGSGSSSSGRRLEFAIADAGCGMLSKVARIHPRISTDLDAIHWCLQRGNTTARSPEDRWLQRLPEDSVVNPYPESVRTTQTEDHHQGEGLWRLQELIRLFCGSMSILSGDGELLLTDKSNSSVKTEFRWRGTVIGFQIFIPTDDSKLNTSNEELEKIAERLGI